jgi:hypothetical protein
MIPKSYRIRSKGDAILPEEKIYERVGKFPNFLSKSPSKKFTCARNQARNKPGRPLSELVGPEAPELRRSSDQDVL